jgi:hypothetical protein
VKAHDNLDLVKLAGTIKNGQIVVEGLMLPEGTNVTVTVTDKLDHPPIRRIELDDHGEIIMTPELAAEFEAEEREADRGGGLPWEDVREMLRRSRPR